MKKCNNEKHNDDMLLIFAQQSFCMYQSGSPKYAGGFFSHCPFCGEILIEQSKAKLVNMPNDLIKSIMESELKERGISELEEFSKPAAPMLETTTYADIPPITNPNACNLVIYSADDCYQCVHIGNDKSIIPCSECLRRPHDLCCSDKFEQRLTDVEVEEILQQIRDSYHYQGE